MAPDTSQTLPVHPRIALITVAYNSAKALVHFWSDAAARAGVEWIVVDNDSADRSVAVAEELGARVIATGANLGFSAGNNVGAAAADADVLIFCNPDVSVSADGIARLAADVMLYGGIVAPQLVNIDGSLQENGRGIPYLASKVKHLLRIDDPRYCRLAEEGQTIEVVWVMGAVVAISRADFDRLGGWDDGFFVYYEDSDLGLRATELGMGVRVDGSVRWQHGWARETGKGLSWAAWKLEFRAAWRFFLKHPYCLVPLGSRSRKLRRIAELRMGEAQ